MDLDIFSALSSRWPLVRIARGHSSGASGQMAVWLYSANDRWLLIRSLPDTWPPPGKTTCSTLTDSSKAGDCIYKCSWPPYGIPYATPYARVLNTHDSLSGSLCHMKGTWQMLCTLHRCPTRAP